MLEIKGERIYLRDHISGDLDIFHRWMSDPVVTRYLSFQTDSIEQSEKHLAHAIEQNTAQPRKDFFLPLYNLKRNKSLARLVFLPNPYRSKAV